MNENERRIAQLKAQYNAQPLPPMLEERIRDSMKKELYDEQVKEKNHTRSRTLRGLYRGLGTAAAVLVVMTILVNTSPSIAKAMQEVPVLGPIAQLLTFRTYEDSQYGIEAQIQIPQVDALEGPARDNLQAAIDAYAQSLIDLHEESVGLAQQAMEENPEVFEDSMTAHQDLQCDATVVAETDDMFCLDMNATLVMAGATQFQKHFVLDKRSGQVLSLADLFDEDSGYASLLEAEIKKQMEANAAADSDLSYFPEMVKIEADQDFYITAQGQLVLCFDEYDVAPGYMGAQSFEIPTEAIASVLHTDLIH